VTSVNSHLCHASTCFHFSRNWLSAQLLPDPGDQPPVRAKPTSTWIVQQLRQAFPYESAPRFLLFDHDQKYGLEVPAALRSLPINGVQTSFASPWQNGVAERWVGSCRRELLDHVIALNERHLKRLLSAYVSYHHEDRTHLGLGKGTPGRRTRWRTSGRVLSQDRLGGLHQPEDLSVPPLYTYICVRPVDA
jgi:putative transposase